MNLIEFRQDLWHQKTKVPGLLCGVCMIQNLAILTQYQRVTDRQTHNDSIYRASIALHSKNAVVLSASAKNTSTTAWAEPHK